MTIIPVRVKKFDQAKLAVSMVYFPVVGLLLALFLAVICNLFLFLGFTGFIVNVILVVTLIMITGGMHLDGLSDTFDALSSGKDKIKMLEIMRDSHCGVMGILSIICVVLLKISFLSSINFAYKISALILMCVLSRWSLVFLLFLFPYARKEGKGKVFSEGMTLRIFILASLICLSCVFAVFKINGLLIVAAVALTVFTFGKFITRKIDGISGDSLGAANEIAEVMTLFCVSILANYNI